MGRPSKYPEEFRREAVALFRSSDRTRVEVARSPNPGGLEMHGNAPLTPEGRLRLCHRIANGRTVAAAAESMNISRQYALGLKWSVQRRG
jgi:hypothetical protein